MSIIISVDIVLRRYVTIFPCDAPCKTRHHVRVGGNDGIGGLTLDGYGLGCWVDELHGCPALWIPAYAGMTDLSVGIVLFHPLIPCQALGQALIPLPSRERGIGGRCCLVVTLPYPSGLRIKSAMTVLMAGMTRGVSPPCGYCLKASMTGRRFM